MRIFHSYACLPEVRTYGWLGENNLGNPHEPAFNTCGEGVDDTHTHTRTHTHIYILIPKPQEFWTVDEYQTSKASHHDAFKKPFSELKPAHPTLMQTKQITKVK